ncbi:MAG: GTPase HflX [Chitinophagales bacterium]|nr:MAG: GTPase HflX [Chitinophagales bacterium]
MTTSLPHISGNGVQERAVLVGLVTPQQPEPLLQEYLDELAFLALTAGAKAEKRFFQKTDHPDPRTYVGKGKLMEIKKYVQEKDIDLVIFDDEITPAQQRNIEKELRCKILDRSMLILDIFAQRARTQQATVQVELAQMLYLLPRLRGMWQHLDRVKGGIGMRGAGEKEIETDRRLVKDKIATLKDKLKKIDRQNTTQRKARGELIRVALVGYTNVGKSTLMNLLSKSDVFAENKLFATLDTTVRKVVIDNVPFLLSDTVGFIRKLPHHLVESFKSTLDEVRESDILLHVVDLAHPSFEDQIHVVNQTLVEIGAHDKPTLIVFNKYDLFEKQHFDAFLPSETKQELMTEFQRTWQAKTHNRCVFVSALQKQGIDELRSRILLDVTDLYHKRYPYRAGFY